MTKVKSIKKASTLSISGGFEEYCRLLDYSPIEFLWPYSECIAADAFAVIPYFDAVVAGAPVTRSLAAPADKLQGSRFVGFDAEVVAVAVAVFRFTAGR